MFRVFFLILFLLSSAALSLIPKSTSPIRKSVSPVPKPTSLAALDIIGKASDKDLTARLKVLKNKLSEDANVNVYIINTGTDSQIRKRERQIKKALAFHKIDTKRVLIVRDENQNELMTRIYIVPQNVELPTP